ncbi:MAG TPA: hypothetical protein VM778_04905 [Gemmatimonadota bacterium]|nr:hypothetical protein [Gemmatimonadota bacterium]
MRLLRRIPALTLAALLASAPLATCLLAVQPGPAMAMAPGEDCDAPRPDHAPALCGTQSVPSTAPTGVEAPPVAVLPADVGESGRIAAIAPSGAPPRDAGPPGARPPAWLRHGAFLI